MSHDTATPSADLPHHPLTDLARLAVRVTGAVAARVTRVQPIGTTPESGQWPDGVWTDETAGMIQPIIGIDGELLGEISLRGGDEIDQAGRDALVAFGRVAAQCLENERSSARAFDALEDSARAEEQLVRVAGQVAHDLNNPLAAVAMCLEIARDQVDDSQTLLVSLLERASGSAARMKQMTADLMAYAHAPTDGTTDLQAELEAALQALEGLVPGDVVVHQPLPTVAGQPGDYRVVLVAVLENALKFAVEGEPVRLDVGAQRQGDQWRLTFADRGRGIPAEDRGRVLDPMVRLDKRIPGLGMGLTTARRVVNAHGGSVGVEENAQGGTTIWFTLPVLTEQ